MNYWIPREKWQIVNWLMVQYPGTSKFKWQTKSKRQLYAIYFNIRNKM